MAEYKLKTPIHKLDGEIVETVQLKDGFTGADLEKIGNAKGEGSVLITIANAVVVGLSETYIRNMDARDVKALAQKAQAFFADGEG